MSQPGPRIGILGGTFDPIHHGHLFVAEEARVRFGLDRVLIVPHGQAPHKAARDISGARHRLAMCELAVSGNAALEASRIEIERPGPSYTIDTLLALRERHGAAADLFFIIGADAVLEIHTWFRPDDVLREARFIAVNRPGSDLSRLASVIGEERAESVRIMDVPGLDISATDVRRRVAEGRAVRYLVPDAVLAYIEKEGLYAALPAQPGCSERRSAVDHRSGH